MFAIRQESIALFGTFLIAVAAGCADDSGGDQIADAGAREDAGTASSDMSDAAPNNGTSTDGGPTTALNAVDDYLAVRRGETSQIDVLSNDERSGGELTIRSFDQPAVGRVELRDDGLFYTASAFSEPSSFRYVVEDSTGATDEATVWVTPYDSDAGPSAPVVFVPQTGLSPAQIAVIIDSTNPDSVAIGEYYASARGIPDANVIRVEIATDGNVMPAAEFDALYASVADQLPEGIQGFALAWIAPYRVDCQSMTTAFAVGGFDDAYCNTTGETCGGTAQSALFASESRRPFDDHAIRPAMMLAATSVDDAEALIDRGIAADGTFPPGDGHLVRTTDSRRSVRYPDFALLPDAYDTTGGISFIYTDNSDGSGSNQIRDAEDVLFYFTGLTSVGDLATNTYRPGAVADHLTSFGGRLTSNGGQMSVVRWLEGGATASFGTVVEPCNYTQKFPRVSELVDHYYRGATVLEAYWKSVAWPGEGVFVGEPLARPWGGARLYFEAGTLTIDTTMMSPGVTYVLHAADGPDGPWEIVQDELTTEVPQTVSIVVAEADRRFYRLSAAE